MDRDSYIEIMAFPGEWERWGMLPDESLALLIAGYEPGHEAASEHDRHGVFQWWLKRQLTTEQLITLARLSWLDPDPHMGGYVRECISSHAGFTPAVAEAIASPYHRA